MSPLCDWLSENLVGLAALIGASFWFWKLRVEEMLKIRIQLAMALSDLLWEIALAVNSFSGPQGSERDRWLEFCERKSKFHPQLVAIFPRASLLMRPTLSSQLHEILRVVAAM